MGRVKQKVKQFFKQNRIASVKQTYRDSKLASKSGASGQSRTDDRRFTKPLLYH